MQAEPLSIERLAELIKEVSGISFDPSELDSNSGEAYEELGVDSLARMELITALEDIYGMEVPDEVGSEMSTPGKTISLMNQLTLSKAA